MPRSVHDILRHADQLANRFEAYEPRPGDARDPEPYALLRAAVLERAAAERRVLDAVGQARSSSYSWATIGALLGTSGEAARQRYGRVLEDR
jgi:hypothetical protein